eukprot:CAMPEP_0118886666 /NCGR_PEP_ID=MMETSP1163-20130328/24673_1 /TAXON_ID=124430 /ORGANISM="Phaeomonas parva, Strain CCMP2877" /LENGTH=128 /DNA_ID=CAMNT_0006824939 /DNA_START=1 /DNA_END=383 /DNA_ORIENTATION=-
MSAMADSLQRLTAACAAGDVEAITSALAEVSRGPASGRGGRGCAGVGVVVRSLQGVGGDLCGIFRVLRAGDSPRLGVRRCACAPVCVSVFVCVETEREEAAVRAGASPRIPSKATEAQPPLSIRGSPP